MPVNIEFCAAPDRLGKFNPYTAAYRAVGSTRYQDFSPLDPYAVSSHLERAHTLAWTGDRAALCDTLCREYQSLVAPAPVVDNIAALAHENTFALVAGHQPALFGGPLFLFWKLLGVIRLAEILNAERDDFTFVPIYWNGSEDHNPAEFGRVTLFDDAHDLQHFSLPDAPANRMAHNIPATVTDTLLTEIENALPDTEFRDGIIATLREHTRGNLGETQTRLILKWFGETGLIVVEPHMLRSLAAPVLVRALRESVDVHAALVRATDDIRDDGFSPPLPVPDVERTLVYRIRDGERHRLRVTADGFQTEDGVEAFPGDEVFAELTAHPERFSPSAALRPVVQSAVLPVITYLAGGGELAYHTQLREMFVQFGETLPLLLPRPAGSILKRSLLKTARKLELPPQDLISPNWGWARVEARFSQHLAAQETAFATFAATLGAGMKTLGDELTQAGVKNLNELTREQEKFLGRLDGLNRRLREQNPVLGTAARKQYHRLRKFVLPGETYQDLSLWSIYVLALFGEDLLTAIRPHLDPLSRDHHLFMIG